MDELIVQNPLFGSRVSLIELLLASDMEVLTALCEVALIPEEGRTLAEALIEFFEAHGRVEKLLFWAISKEVRTNNTASTLFRGSCEATKLMPVIYARVGSEYLRKMIGPLVKDIVSSNQSFEIDPSKADKGIDVKDNLKKLLAIATELLNHIVTSTDEFPVFLKGIFYYAKKEVTNKFPEASDIIVGVFFFLRYLLPAIVTPNAYGLLSEPPSEEAQRGLILISKLLQNLSNGVYYDSTEEFTLELNNWITTHISKLRDFFAKIAVQEPHKLKLNCEKDQVWALSIILDALKQNRERIFSSLVKIETKKAFLEIVDDANSEQRKLVRSRSLGTKSLMKKKFSTNTLHVPSTNRNNNNNVTEEDIRIDRLIEILENEEEHRRQIEQKTVLFQRKLQSQISELDSKYQKIFSKLESENSELRSKIHSLEQTVNSLLIQLEKK